MRLLDEQERRNRESTSQDTEIKANFERIIKQKAESDVELKTSRDQIAALKDEVERLRRHVHSLQQESADKEVKIVHLEKQKSVAAQDMMGLNIALDSKQQELELVRSVSRLSGD
jgi:chromosome segregation ATPase